MKRTKQLGFFVGAVLLVFAGCKNESHQSTTTSAPATVQAASPPSLSEYHPLGEGYGFFNVIHTELNYQGTGQQAALLEIVYNTVDARAGRPAGYFFVLYNAKVEPRSVYSKTCDLGEMLIDNGQPWKQLNYEVHGEGLMTGSVGLEREKWAWEYPLEGCRFFLFGVRSDRVHIPEDAWDKGAQLAAKPAASDRATETDDNRQKAPSSETAETNAGVDASTDSEIRLLLQKWIDSFQVMDPVEHANCYASVVETYFRWHDVPIDQVRRDKEKAFASIAKVSRYEIKDLTIALDAPDRPEAVFHKFWDTSTVRGGTFAGEEIERLRFAKFDGTWRIVSEEEVKILKVTRR